MMSLAYAKLATGQLRVNFNMSNAMQEAVLELIEEQLAQEEIQKSPSAEMKTPNFMPVVTMHSL